ncbi:MAG TPA: hypothetical protein VG848_07845 [Acetobacteraceae bacterium]|nr:hypothetical protein [Acetobacteraceae bacterium]
MIFHRFGVLAIAALLLVGGNPRADSLKPAEAKIVDLGAVNGIVYYTVEPTGYRVVATLVPSGLPSGHSPGLLSVVRRVAILGPEQSVTLSSSGGVGEPAIEARIVRHGGQIFVEDGGQLDEVTNASHTASIR